MSPHRARRVLAVVAAMLACVALAACGSSSSSSSTASAGGTTAAATTGAKLKVKPKTIGWVDCCLAGSYQQRIYDNAKSAFKHVGWTVKLTDTASDPAKSLEAVSSYVTQGVDAIVLSSITPSTVRAGLLQAKAKGIPVIEVGGEVDGFPAPDLGVNAYYGESEKDLSTPLGDKIAEDLKPGDEIGIIYTTLLKSGKDRQQAIVDAVKAKGIKVVGSVDSGFGFGDGQKSAASLMQAHPKLKALVPVYDLWSAATVAAVKQAKRPVKVYAFYADLVNTPIMRKDPDIMVALTDGDAADCSFVLTDQLLKVFSGEQKTADPNAADGKFSYQAISPDKLPPAGQNGLKPPAASSQPWFTSWDAKYDYQQ
jgi:ABC-type sugar transport system substrate-binding protein